MALLHACIIGFDGGVDRAQIHPFFIYEAELRTRCNLTFTRRYASGVDEILAVGRGESCDLWFIQGRCFESTDDEEKERVLRELRQRAPVVFLDSVASGYGHDFRILPWVDVYVKKAIYRDLDLYQNRYLDGRIFADFLTRANHPTRWIANRRFYLRHLRDGTSFLRFLAQTTRKNLAGSAFCWSSTLDPGQAHKLVQGWTIGTQQRLYERFRDQQFQPYRTADRPIDVHCRVSTELGFLRDWYYFHRQSTIDALQALSPAYHVVATNERLPREQYFDELYRSKIVVSPFGWGEICYRDFEAVVSGSLLVKPSMEHLQTSPDIYEPGTTYVPVRWDLSDLAETCRYYLEHPAERARIVQAAGAAYARYFREAQFLRQIDRILAALPVS